MNSLLFLFIGSVLNEIEAVDAILLVEDRSAG